MDLNAGRYLDGEPMDAVVADGFELLLATAGGVRTQGERAGHAQVSLWRNWRQTDTSRLAALRARIPPDGRPLAVAPTCAPRPTPPALAVFRRADGRHATERVGLVLPTSLCSTQIARLAAERLNARAAGRAAGVTRFLGFTHTEGCGFGGETMYELLHRTYRGYLTHPNVAVALLLEHGCEKVPNDVMRHHLAAAGVDPAGFGWASVQLDGGIERVLARIDAWFDERLAALPPAAPVTGGPGCLRLALQSAGAADPATAQALAAVAATVLAAGGSVLLPASDPLLAPGVFRTLVLGTVAPRPTLAYGEPLVREGLHVVATESSHWTENLTGLGGCGAHLALTLVQEHARQGHPLLPVLQVAGPGVLPAAAAAEIDAELTGNPAADADALLALVARVADRRQTPVANAQGNVDFQLTRGELGLTT
jgi:altronate dehydratase